MISSVYRRALVLVLGLLAIPAIASAQFTIQRTSSPIFYNDVGNSPSLRCMYASYEVTNTGGSTIADVWVDIGSFTGGVVGRASSEDGVVELGAMAPGQRKTAYFYLQANTTTGVAQGHTVHVYASRPPASAALTQSYTITSVQSTIAANANKVTTVVSGPNPPQVGGIVTITVSGHTGTIGSPPVLAFSPATDILWSAAVFEMISTRITFSGSPNAGVVTDSLIVAPADPGNTDYVAVYTMRAAGTTVAPTAVTPIGYFASGANVKHTDTGNYGGFAPIPPPESKLTLTKSATPTYIVDGGVSTYTIHIVNSGFADGTLDDIKDVLPGASTIVPGSSTFNGLPIGDPSVAGRTAFWYGPFTLLANSSRDLIYQASFPATAGTFVNQALAHVGSAIIDTTLALSDSLPGKAPIVVYVHNADISITKGDVPDPVGPDSTLTYTLVVSNAGPDTAFTTSALDTLPAGVAFVNASATQGTASEASGVVQVAIGTLAPGASSTITIVVTPSAVGTLVNTARATNARVDYVPGNNTATTTTTVRLPPLPDMQIIKRAAPAMFTVGQTVAYILSLTNIGTGPTEGAIAVVDTLPAGLSYVSGSGPGWSVSESGGVVTATNPGPIALGDSALVTIQATVRAAAFPGVLNLARVTTFRDSDAANDTSSVVNAVLGAPDLQLAKRHAGDFTVGSPGQYTITVTNVGNLPTTSTITVVDTLPSGLGYIAAAGAGWTTNETSGIVTATYASLILPGDSTSFTLDVTVGPAAAPWAVNTAVSTVTGDVGAANDRGVDSTRVIGFPDVQMIKRAVGAPFTVGGIATWTLTATNVGSGATTGPITITDTLAPGLTFGSAAGTGFSTSFADPTVTATYAAALAPGDSATVTLTARVSAAASPAVANTALANTPGDTSAANDSSTATSAVNDAPDVRLAKRHAGDFTVGVNGQYVIKVYNEGSAPTTGTVTVLDTLPSGLGFVAGTGAGWTVNEALGIVTATNAGPIAAGDSASFTLDVSVGPTAMPSVVNAAVASATGDLNGGNDRGIDPTNVSAALTPDLQVVKRALAPPFTVGGTASYAITVTNVGSAATTGTITLSDTLPAGLTWISGSGAGWIVTQSLGTVTATNAGPIAPGDSALVTLTVQVGAAAAPSVINSATGSTPGDASPGNDTGSSTTAVNDAPDLRLSKSHASDFTVGTNGQYRITLFNDGSIPTTGTITVLDTLPFGLGFVAGTGAGWSVNEALGIVTATNAGPIAVGDSASFTLDVTVGPAAFPGVTNSAVAQTAGDIDGGNDRGVDPTIVQPAPVFPPDLQIVKRAPGAPFTVGGSATYVLSVTNVGTGPTTGGITVTDVLPTGMTFVSGSGAGWIVTAALGTVTATNAGPIASGDSSLVSIITSVGAAALPSVSNSASVATAGDGNAANDNGSNTSAVNGAPDLAMGKRHFGAFTVGQPGVYTLTVRNVGSIATTGTITVVDSLPAGLTYVTGNGAGWAFGAAGQVVTATNAGPIAAGDSLSFTLTVAVGNAALPGVTNVAVARTPGDASPANDRATDATAISGAPDVALLKRHVGSFTVGANAAYQIAVLNLGTAATAGTITVRDTLPTGLTFVSLTGAGWSSSLSGNVVTATNPGPIAPADSATFTLTVLVGPAAYPSVLNAAVAQVAGDNNPGNDRGSDVPAPVVYASQLALEKRAAPSIVEPADVVTYTLVLSNLGVSQVPGVVVRDTLPVGFRFADGTASVNGTPIADPAGAPGAGLAFNVGTVPANGAITLRYRALVGTSAVLGDGINRAYAENAGLNLRSNTAAAKVTIHGGVFADDGVLAGKVWADCDCDSNRAQGKEELGVPGVRVYLEDGRSAITDVEGKYHFEAVAPRLHTVKLDKTTLPQGAHIEVVNTRDGMSPGTRFADVKDGELYRADFALAGCDPAFVSELKARRELGEVRAAIQTAQPTTAANVEPGATRVLDGTPWAGEAGARSDDGAFYHVMPGHLNDGAAGSDPRNLLSAASSLVPDAPGTPGLLAGHIRNAAPGLEISVPRRPAPADGHTLVPVTVRVPGDAPVAVTLDSDLGLWQVADQDPKHDGIQTSVTHQATFLLVAPASAGAGTVRVTEDTDLKGKVTSDGPTALSGVREAEAGLVFIPSPRPWLVTGTIEGRYDGRSVHADELAPGQIRDRFEDAFTVVRSDNSDGTSNLGARGAMFAKGTIGGNVGVTFRFDSEHAADRRRFDDIRPDEGEANFGDASVSGFEAQSTERLYARLERGRSYALYGDFQTAALDPIRVLGAYFRGVNGGRAHLENGRAAVDAFATHDKDRQVVDEIDGRGISGPYPLSRKDGVLNSERVEIVTRDRNNPSVILARKVMTRFADYTIEPFTGRLLFRAPVEALDERLNPVSVRVTYEVEGGGDRFWTAGGSANLKPVDGVELMGSYVKEDDPAREHVQYGAGATVKLLARTFVTGEWARTDSAGTGAANAYRGEIRHQADHLDLRGFAVRTDAGFDNPSSGYAAGRQEWGGGARYLLGGRSSATAEGVLTKDLATGGRRKGASLGLERRLSDGVSLGIGYRWARESSLPAGGGNAVPTPNETDAARARLTAQFNPRTSLFAEYENDLGAGNAKRFEVGGDRRLTDHVRAYARHEFLNGFAGPYALDDRQGLNTTVFGFAADGQSDLSAFSEYRVRDAFAGRNAEAAMGLRDRFRLSPAVRVLLSVERVTPTKGAPASDGMTAIASGLEWTGDPLTKGSLRLEYRKSQDQPQWLASGGLARKLGRDWTGLARSMWSWAPSQQRTVARDEIAFALRETDRNHWNVLGRIEHRLDEQQLEPGFDSRHEVFLASTRLNLRASRPLTLMGRAAGKWTFDDAGARTIDGRGALASLRALYDLSPRLDLALAARSRFDGSFDRRTDGLGAELGVLVTKNLRLSGGYNAFGFHDPDFASLERTDKGPFLAFGFKFDEGLFGGGHDAVPAAASAPAEGVQRGAIATAPRDTLSANWARVSDPAIAGDLRTIDAWRARVDAQPDSLGIYGRAKARAWLTLARAEYTDNDRTGDAERALANAVALYHAMNGASGIDSAAFAAASARSLPRPEHLAAGDIDARIATLKTHPGFHCAEEEVARYEVELAWAGNEDRDQGACKATPHEQEAQRLAESIEAKEAECVKPVAIPVPVDTTQAPPVMPNSEIEEIQAALAEIPSGIHFALNRNDLSATSRDVLARIGVVMAKYPHIKVDLKGHTDSRGSVAYNLALSKRRADAVQNGLEAVGVDSARITTSFAGKGELLTAEKDVRDLALNRRVDFHYYDPTGTEIIAKKQTGDIQIEKPKPARRPARKRAVKTTR